VAVRNMRGTETAQKLHLAIGIPGVGTGLATAPVIYGGSDLRHAYLESDGSSCMRRSLCINAATFLTARSGRPSTLMNLPLPKQLTCCTP